MPYLMRAPTDVEQRLGAGMVAHLQTLGGEGLTDSTAEIAIAVMLALYVQHRAALSPADKEALTRIVDATRKIAGMQQSLQLRTGDDFKRSVISERERGKL